MSQILSITPTLQVTSFDDASLFYSLLGFKEDWRWPERNATHMSLSQDGTTFILALKGDIASIQRADLYFRVVDINLFHSHLSTKIDDLSPLIKSAYGMLDFSITDPWGHHLVFGAPSGEWKG